MATTTTITATWIFSATLLLHFLLPLPSNAQSPPVSAPTVDVAMTAPSPGLDCMPYLFNMSDCLSYVVAGSNLTKPDKGCCPELGDLVENQPICLCQLLGNPGSLGIEIDLKKAIKLPDVCKVSTPPVSLCAAIGVPVSVPTPSEPTASPSPSPSQSLSSSSEGLASSPDSINKDSYGVRSNEASLFALYLKESILY